MKTNILRQMAIIQANSFLNATKYFCSKFNFLPKILLY